MANTNDRLNRCLQLGYEGYKKGINAPALCIEWRKQLDGLTIEEESGSKEWSDGWHNAREEVSRSKFPELYQ